MVRRYVVKTVFAVLVREEAREGAREGKGAESSQVLKMSQPA